MLGKTAIIVLTHNRKDLVEKSLRSLIAARKTAVESGNLRAADIFVYDDGSDEYDADWLQSIAPESRVVCLPKQHPHPTSSVSILRSRAFQDALDADDYRYFLHTDSDMVFDPSAFAQIERLTKACPDWGVIGLFNPSLWDWESRSKESGPDWYLHTFCGGTMFMRRPNAVSVKIPQSSRGHPAWDGYYSKLIGHKRACISRTSYVEHIGVGIHRSNPARNPTEWLRALSIRYGSTRASAVTDSTSERAGGLPS